MDIQTMLNNAMAARRAEEMKNSTQLTLGEMILKLEAVKNKELPVYFDEEKYRPTGVDSWRGSYCELALNYEGAGGYYEHKPECPRDPKWDDYTCDCKSISTQLPENPTVNNLLEMLKKIPGRIFIGYKGGDFLMGKTTPIWVANYGTSSGFKQEEDKYNQSVIDVSEKDGKVIIITEAINY
jgi:hypothetical protein